MGNIAEGYINNDVTSITITTTRLKLVKSISLHEIGHALGLEHNDRPYSIMNPTIYEHSRISHHDIEEVLSKQQSGLRNWSKE
jgi:predicted Zn-dependent protease